MFLNEKKYKKKPILIGLTGGIGSGKSTVAKIFISLGIKVYNSDVEAKFIINTDKDVMASIKQNFGEDIYVNNCINSKLLAQKVFNNSLALNKLNAIVHPKVKLHFENWVKQNSNNNYLIKEAAILIESGTYKNMDKIIVVSSSDDLKIKRVSNRDKWTEEEIKNRLKTQLSEENRLTYANYIINNNEKDLVIPQVLTIHNALLKL